MSPPRFLYSSSPGAQHRRSLPSTRTWPQEATGQGSGSFPPLSSVPSRSLDFPLRAKCLLYSPLSPVEKPLQAVRIQGHFIFHSVGQQVKATKAGWDCPSPPPQPAHKTDNPPNPDTVFPLQSQVLKSESWHVLLNSATSFCASHAGLQDQEGLSPPRLAWAQELGVPC